MSLLTTASVAAFVGCNANDTLLKVIHPAEEMALEQIKGWTLEEAEHTEKISGDGTNKLFLANIPVTAVDSITIRDYGVVASASDAYVWDAEGTIIWRYGTFPIDALNVTVVYTAGYTSDTLPARYDLWIKEVCKSVYDRVKMDAGGVTDLKLEGLSMTLTEITERADLKALAGPARIFC